MVTDHRENHTVPGGIFAAMMFVKRFASSDDSNGDVGAIAGQEVYKYITENFLDPKIWASVQIFQASFSIQ